MTRPTRIGRPFPILSSRLGGFIGVDEGAPPPADCCDDATTLPDRAAEENGAYAVTWQETFGTADDQNLLVGTDSDGGGTATFTDPTNANDGTVATKTYVSAYAGPPTTGYLVADLGSAVYVETMTAYEDWECSSDPTAGGLEIESSDDGSTWAAVSTTKVWNGLPGTSGGKVDFTLDTPAVHRYWRLVAFHPTTGFNCGTEVYTWEIQGATASGIAWNVPAPRTIDGDDATYEEISSPDVLRIDLGSPFEIASVRLRIGTETSGSRTYTLSAATLPDYSDAVTIATLSFTATGSYTAQDVTAQWFATDEYQYWQLSGNDETRRIYALELYEATLATNHEHTLDSLSDVATSGVSDGQVLTWDAGTSEWIPTTVSGAVPDGTDPGDILVWDGDSWEVLPIGADDLILKADSGETLGVRWATDETGGGGGGGDGKRYVADLPASPDSTDDEFNDTSGMSGPTNGLDAKWSKHNLGTSTWIKLDDSVAPGELFFDIPTGQSASQAIYQTVPAGDWTYAARTKLHYADSRTMWAILCVDSSGTGACAVLDTNANSVGVRTLTTWTDGGGGTFFGSAGPWLNDQGGAGGHIVVTLRKASGVYSCGVSYSDRLLPGNYFEVSHTPSSFTPAYIGFGRVFSTGKNMVELDFFRRVA